MAYEAWVRPDALTHGRQTALDGSPMPAEHTIRNLFHSIYGRNERAATFREFQRYFKKGYREAAKQKGKQNPTGLRAQVRRLPSGEVQLKIPLTRNPASLKQAMKAVKKLGRRVKSVVVTGMKRAKRNSFEPGLSPTWYRKGQAAGRSTKWKDMYDAWHWAKGKPTISGKRVTAQESFFQGWFDATQRP